MSNAVARTAVGPMVVVAVEQNENSPLVDDELAHRMLPRVGRIAVAGARWRPLRQAMIAVTEKKIPGAWANMLCRKRYIDETLMDVVTEMDAVVILGAGYDTRAYRLPGLAGIPVYEADLPDNIDRKRAAVEKLDGCLPGNVTLVPVDLRTQDIADVLAQHGYRRDGKTLFVWEAVTQYLREIDVRAAFEFFADARTGSRLVFTYIRKDFLDGATLHGGEAAHRQLVRKRRSWHFGLEPGQVGGFLAPYEWTVVEQAGHIEFTDRYLEPVGRSMPVSEIERCVHAVKR